jgi:hypothetical protein
MDTLRPQSYALKSWGLSPDAETRGGEPCIAMRSPPLSETLSTPPRLVLAARSAVARGPAPWTQASEHGPSDSLVFLGIGTCRKVLWRVRSFVSE